MKDNGFKLTVERSRRYPAQTITDVDYALLENTPAQAKNLLNGLERAAADIGVHVNAHKTEYICFNQNGYISTLNAISLKLVDKLTYLGSSVSSTEKDVNTRLVKAWTAIDWLSVIWKSDLTDKIKCSFFQAAVVSIRPNVCTTWTLIKHVEKKLNSNYSRMLLYGHLPPITRTIQVRGTRHAGYCWRSKGEFISDILLWTPSHGRAKSGRPARINIQQLCADTGCSLEDLLEAMDDKDKGRVRAREIRAGNAI